MYIYLKLLPESVSLGIYFAEEKPFLSLEHQLLIFASSPEAFAFAHNCSSVGNNPDLT